VPRSYFELSPDGQREILDEAFSETGRLPSVIEKDIWLTLVLQLLFAMPGRKAMEFKGGASLSKVHGVIKRFSEDVEYGGFQGTGLWAQCF
jgi:predicted nucleotidyltransferase component of viral defense system